LIMGASSSLPRVFDGIVRSLHVSE
jgi:hypothetical protein